jgi:hypothetical protein
MKCYFLSGFIVLVVLAGCADPNSTVPPRGEPQSSEHEYSCGGDATFTARDIEDGPEPSAEILDALRKLRQTMDGAMLPEDGWKVVSDDDQTTTLLAPLRGSFASATFEKSDGGWEPRGWGECVPRLVQEDKSVLRWAFTRGSYPPDADATELEVLVTEVQCSGGRDIEGLIEPRVAYGESTIEVVLLAPGLSTGKNEAYTCLGTSPTEYTLGLEEPVGDREVIDVSVYPAVEPVPGTRLP